MMPQKDTEGGESVAKLCHSRCERLSCENRSEKILNEELAVQLNELLPDKIEKEENIKILKCQLAVVRQQLTDEKAS